MDELIAGFSRQLLEALKISSKYEFIKSAEMPDQVVIAGLGGSGIGATIVQNYTQYTAPVPVIVTKNYFLPGFIGSNTLVIACSYSGNTEETIACLKEAIKKKARVVCITSGGTIAQLAKKNNLDCILIPSGMPPRACLGYSLVQLLATFKHFGLIKSNYTKAVQDAARLLDTEERDIKLTAKKLAKKAIGKIPIIYVENDMEGVAVRWRQQINENGKMLCWHHTIPEMNHNELVGWRTERQELFVIFLRNDSDFKRSQMRMEINKKLIKPYATSIVECYSKGKYYLEKALYLIHLGDWFSWYLAQEGGMDATEVKVIDYLKGALVKQ
jgi:glucose/mannose-6-phosphate isomerase